MNVQPDTVILMGNAETPLLLASGSRIRADLLARAGLAFAVEVAPIDEESIKEGLKAAGKSADEAATTLAELKALKISARHAGALVIGCDQMLSCGETWFDKPTDRKAAGEQLRRLSGKRHQLHSAVCVARDQGILWHHVERASLVMRELSETFLERYLAAAGDTVLGSVGAYQLEGLGAQLFSRIDGDYFAILGLPLLPLLAFLRGHDMVPA